jgi:hypothetical protein
MVARHKNSIFPHLIYDTSKFRFCDRIESRKGSRALDSKSAYEWEFKKGRQVRLKYRSTNLVSGFALVLISLLVQFFFIGRYLDNSIVSTYAPTAVDAQDYANRALTWHEKGFGAAFQDAYRMPGYPSVILAMHVLFPNSTFLAIKLLQMFGAAISCALIKAILEKLIPSWLAFLSAIFFAFLPIWHFTPVLLGESLTSTIFVVLLYALSRQSTRFPSKMQLLSVSLLITVLTFLKPNNLLLLIAVLTFFGLKTNKRFLYVATFITLLTFIFLSPWLKFTANVQPGFHGLTTNSGINLYIGTGMILNYDNGVLAQSATKWKVDPKSNPQDVLQVPSDLAPGQLNAYFQDKAVDIWKKRTLNEIRYGFDKALIAFGFKGNSALDYSLGLLNFLSLIAAIYLLNFTELRVWAITYFSTILILGFQAMLFQADRRFIAPVVFPLLTINLFLAIGRFMMNRFLIFKV